MFPSVLNMSDEEMCEARKSVERLQRAVSCAGDVLSSVYLDPSSIGNNLHTAMLSQTAVSPAVTKLPVDWLSEGLVVGYYAAARMAGYTPLAFGTHRGWSVVPIIDGAEKYGRYTVTCHGVMHDVIDHDVSKGVEGMVDECRAFGSLLFFLESVDDTGAVRAAAAFRRVYIQHVKDDMEWHVGVPVPNVPVDCLGTRGQSSVDTFYDELYPSWHPDPVDALELVRGLVAEGYVSARSAYGKDVSRYVCSRGAMVASLEQAKISVPDTQAHVLVAVVWDCRLAEGRVLVRSGAKHYEGAVDQRCSVSQQLLLSVLFRRVVV